MKKKKDKRWVPRVPTAKPTIWHKDKSAYSRKQKHRKDWKDGESV